MRILTWNINGVRTLPQYHPWNTLRTHDDILEYLNADIICFQEMKSSRQALPKAVAIPPSYDSFFSFPLKKTGYSGVATYTRRTSVIPVKAEEGLTGILQPKPPLSAEEQISTSGHYPPESFHIPDGEEELDFKDLDSEGRAVVIDVGLFVLINVYCPSGGTGTEERGRYKMDFHRLLEERVNILIREGREVIVVGDLNACAAVQDHCEGHLMVARGLTEGLQGEEGFWGMDHRRWIRDWLVDDKTLHGAMVDIVRKFWPDRQGMYTCWNTKISARASNYGTRIDFILITPGLVPWIEAADIQPQIKGSDHCPVFVDLRDEIATSDGTIVKLRDVLGARPTPSGLPEPPRLAAKFWEEHSGKQTLLSTFFGKKDPDSFPLEPSISTTQSQEPLETSSMGTEPPFPPLSIDSATEPDTQPDSSQSQSSPKSPANNSQAKRKIPTETNVGGKLPLKKLRLGPTKKEGEKSHKNRSGQASIANFFSQPKASGPSSSKGKGKSAEVVKSQQDELSSPGASHVDEDADYRLALMLSQADSAPQPSLENGKASAEKEKNGCEGSKQTWSTLLAPIQPPRCTVHGEVTKEFTVNKPGPNKGKRFFICSRPVGPGYDKGRAERLREQVDPEWRCNFFKWSSEVRKEMMARNGDGRNR